MADSLALMEWILSRSSTHASKPKHRVACHREIGHPSHRALPSNGIHSSSCMKTFFYWELEDDELSPVKTRKITRTTGTMRFLFRKFSQGRVHTRVCHSWSEESPEGTCPTICDLGRCPLQKVLQEVLALPSNIGRRSAHCLNKLIQMGAEDTRQQPNACQENNEARPP